jgi:hypothetical protein
MLMVDSNWKWSTVKGKHHQDNQRGYMATWPLQSTVVAQKTNTRERSAKKRDLYRVSTAAARTRLPAANLSALCVFDEAVGEPYETSDACVEIISTPIGRTLVGPQTKKVWCRWEAQVSNLAAHHINASDLCRCSHTATQAHVSRCGVHYCKRSTVNDKQHQNNHRGSLAT